MHLLPKICSVLVCLQLCIIHGQADLQVVKTSRMRDALSTLNRSLQKAARREERDLLLKNTIFPVTVNLTKLVSMIKTQLEALKESQARMETRIEEQENDLERAEARINEQENDLERAEARINEQDTKIEKLTNSLWESKMAGRFTYISTLATNDAAEAECVKQGGHLAVLDTVTKIDYAKEHLIPKDMIDRQDNTKDNPEGKVWLGADCVGCKVAHEDNWQWKSGSKIELDDPLWAKNYNGHDLPYDAANDDAKHLSMRCRGNYYGDCRFINHAAWQTFPYICEKSSGRK